MGKESSFIWSALIHVGTRMWGDRPEDLHCNLQFDEGVYHAITERMREIGMNMVILDTRATRQYPI